MRALNEHVFSHVVGGCGTEETIRRGSSIGVSIKHDTPGCGFVMEQSKPNIFACGGQFNRPKIYARGVWLSKKPLIHRSFRCFLR